VLDQIIPFDTGMYVNFHLPGTIVGNMLLAALLAFYQGKFIKAANPAESYARCMFALWTVFPGPAGHQSKQCDGSTLGRSRCACV
jgi:hypothetical protein